MNTRSVALAITGASGAAYGLRLLEVLLAKQIQVHLVISAPGRIVIAEETDLRLPSKANEICTIFNSRFDAQPGDLQVYGREDWFAPIASGSNPPDAMVICPCTTGTLAEVAAGTSRSLIERAADVALPPNTVDRIGRAEEILRIRKPALPRIFAVPCFEG